MDKFIPYSSTNKTVKESEELSESFFNFMSKRRSIRDFSDQHIPESIIENIIKTAGSAPSGANKQPWYFCAVSNQTLKHKIRALVEKEEQTNYDTRMNDKWLKDLEPLGTNHIKPFIDIAPWLIIVMRKPYDIGQNGEKENNYYVAESVGIATGMLISAIHHAGLVTLTHTPSPMSFLAKVLDRPENEKPYILLPIGYPQKGAKIPNLKKKDVGEIAKYYR